MDLNQFTTKSQEIISNAQQLTLTNGNQAIENTHLLSNYGSRSKCFTHVAKKLGANPNMIVKANDSICNHYLGKGVNIHLSNNTQKSIAESISISKKMKDDFVIEHLILGILKGSDQTSQLLKDNGFSTKEVMAIIKSLRNGQHVTSANQEETYNALNKYAINLNEQKVEN